MFLSSKWAGRFAREQGFEAVCMLFVGLVERMRTGGMQHITGLMGEVKLCLSSPLSERYTKTAKGG